MSTQSEQIDGNATRATREVALIINARSRSGAQVARAAREELERQGVQVARYHLVKRGAQLMRLVREAIESGVSTVVVGGGDGTISSVVNLFARRPELTLGILPVGTGNEVARTLGIPLDLPGACRVIAEGRTTDVDLGEVSGSFFLHTAMVGYPAKANHATPSWVKQRFGRPGYLYSLINAMVGLRPFRVAVTTEHTRWVGETSVIIVGNSRFQGQTRAVAPELSAGESGLLVFAPRNGHWLTFLRIVIGLWVTRRPQPSLLLATSAASVTVEADPPQPIDVDGEYGRPTPAGFRLVKGALRVLVPDTTEEQDRGEA